MLIYRYLSLEYGMKSLQEKMLRVGRLNDLNDPYDCSPHFTGVPNCPGGESFAFDTGYLSGFSKHFGILCFSEIFSDPVVWSHYADNHRGIALGFEYNNTQDDGVYKVQYDNNRVIFQHNDIESSKSRNPVETMFHVVKKGFTVKAKSWEYESERRKFVMLDECTPIGLNYFYGLPVERLKKVLLGVRCSATEEDIYYTLKKYGYKSEIIIEKGEIDIREYKINFKAWRDLP
jgi:hypothetical protein